MTKLMTISTLAVVLSAAIATDANAFPRHGLAFAHSGAAASHHGAVWRGGGWRGGGVAVGSRWDPWGHWGAYYGPMI